MSRRAAWSKRRISGFSLIEVMIAILVLGFGLLGFALLQTMSVRFTKSAQQRTMASNLAYEVIDLMRIQRADGGLGAYNSITYDSFEGVTAGNCPRLVAASISANITRWKCEVRTALPEGEAQVTLTANGDVTVSVRWGDANWAEEEDDRITSFSVRSRI